MSAKTATVRTAVDTFAELAHPSKTHANDAALSVGDSKAQAFVYFAFPASRGSTITAATLTLYTKGSWGGASPTITVQGVNEKFTVTNVTWNKRPAVAGPTATRTRASTGDADAWTFNVAPLLQRVADGVAWYGFRISSDSATIRAFRSAQAGASKPTLAVSWSEAPDAPTRLSPSGGQAVNAAKPVLSMDYTDTSGSTTLAALQVQLNPTASFTAPAFDSGTVLASGSVARIDLSTTAYAGLAEGASTFWRGRVQDAAGEWSAWSAPASFSRTAKGVVTIASPGGSAVDDFTPPVVWAFTATPSKWQVLVITLDGAEVFDSGQVAGTDTSCTIDGPEGEAVLALGVTYLVEVRVWDDENRIGAVSDPAYSNASKLFSIVEVPGVAPVTNLRTETTTPLPGIRLLFDRTTAPDAFTITRNGVPIVTNADPGDLYTGSGTTYAVTLSNVRPNVDNALAVHAIVNGQASARASITARARVAGAWLVDPADPAGSSVFVAGTSGSTFTLGEDGETVIPLGAAAGIRVTQGLRGYEGTVSGVLLGENGHTRDEWVDRALTMRAKPGRRYRLIIGTEVLTVVIGNLNVRPTGDSAPGMRPISFDFWQVDASRVPAVV